MRYTEAKLLQISMEMLADINKDTVDFKPNLMSMKWSPWYFRPGSRTCL